MNRTILLKVDANDFLTWLYEWFYPKTTWGGHSGFEVQDRATALAWISSIKQLRHSEVEQALLLLHELSVKDASTTAKIALTAHKIEQTLTLAVHGSMILPAIDMFKLFKFRCYRVGVSRTQVDAECTTPLFYWMYDELWHLINSTFEVIGKRQESVFNTTENQKLSNTESPKQKGRYRLTKGEIKRRKNIVKDALRRKQESPLKTWKEVANELDISERTLRDWRHNPTYK